MKKKVARILLTVFTLTLALGAANSVFAARSIGEYYRSLNALEAVIYQTNRAKYTKGIAGVNNNDHCYNKSNSNEKMGFWSSILNSSNNLVSKEQKDIKNNERRLIPYTNGGPTNVTYRLKNYNPYIFKAMYLEGTWSPDNK